MPRNINKMTSSLRRGFLVFSVQVFTVILTFLPLVRLLVKEQEREIPPKEIEDILKNDYIIPDVIYNAPEHRMKVRFEVDGNIYHLNYGTHLTPKQARLEPNVSWPVEKGAFYTLMCISPDQPTREDPFLRDWVHWLNVNIKGCNVSTGDDINPYQGPGPNESSGEHRYVFLAFRQNPNFPIKLNRSDESEEMRIFVKRMEFNTDNFIRHFNLGEPWASNYYVSSFNNFQ